MNVYNPKNKKIGSYLIDAGLLSENQVQVALNDQKVTGLRFGDIVVNRGWVRKQTLEYVVKKVVIFERTIGRPLEKNIFKDVYQARKDRKSGAL